MEELHQIQQGNFIELDITEWSIEEQEEHMKLLISSFSHGINLEAAPVGLHPSLVQKYLASGFLIDIRFVLF